jgi:membrane protease YdiL (CAAX protease family)
MYIMSVLIEPLILYLVLFLPSVVPGEVFSAFIIFSINRELTQIFAYNIPAIALIWYLLFKNPIQSEASDKLHRWKLLRPSLKDLIAFLVSLPGLCILGIGISVLSSFLTDVFAVYDILPSSPQIGAPHHLLEWPVMVISCLSTGYLEESYFRFYLLQRFEDAGISRGKSIFLSTVLFSLCHIYEGPWGTLNAALAGMLLCLVFIKDKSLHGIAFAHGGYNIFVYMNGW